MCLETEMGGWVTLFATSLLSHCVVCTILPGHFYCSLHFPDTLSMELPLREPPVLLPNKPSMLPDGVGGHEWGQIAGGNVWV